MKVKVAVLSDDLNFLKRFAKVFQQKYNDKISLSLFSEMSALMQALDEQAIDLLMMDQDMKFKKNEVPESIPIGFFSRIPDVDEINGIPAVCKYQRAEALYRGMLSIYAEHSPNVKLKSISSDARIVLFLSVQGGCGTSSAAAAYAMHCALKGRKIFYLTLERFGSSNLYFNGVDSLSLSDVIYSLKSRNSNLLLKLESAIQTDSSGVEFLNDCKNPYDMFELEDEELEELLKNISQVKKYDEIVVDFSSDMWERKVKLMKDYADKIVYVSDGSPSGINKFEKFCQVIKILERQMDCEILSKMCLLYNRYSTKNSSQMDRAAIPVVGGIHRIEGVSGRKLAGQIARVNDMDLI
ncbi:MAG: hypothetical protein ACOX8H_13520 [Ruminococcus sp.]